jgi:hypothetical protein
MSAPRNYPNALRERSMRLVFQAPEQEPGLSLTAAGPGGARHAARLRSTRPAPPGSNTRSGHTPMLACTTIATDATRSTSLRRAGPVTSPRSRSTPAPHSIPRAAARSPSSATQQRTASAPASSPAPDARESRWATDSELSRSTPSVGPASTTSALAGRRITGAFDSASMSPRAHRAVSIRTLAAAVRAGG